MHRLKKTARWVVGGCGSAGWRAALRLGLPCEADIEQETQALRSWPRALGIFWPQQEPICSWSIAAKGKVSGDVVRSVLKAGDAQPWWTWKNLGFYSERNRNEKPLGGHHQDFLFIFDFLQFKHDRCRFLYNCPAVIAELFGSVVLCLSLIFENSIIITSSVLFLFSLLFHYVHVTSFVIVP